MDLYDYKTKFERKLVRETITVKNPRVSILAATARPLLERYTKDTDWLGGFLARFLMIGGEPRTFQPKRRTNPALEQRIEHLINNVFKTEWGTMGCTSGAATVLDEFSYEIHSELDAFAAGLHPSLSRLADTARRLAALYEIAYQADSPPKKGRTVVVSAYSAECARDLCRASRDHALASLAETTVSDVWMRNLQRVENIIRGAGLAGILRMIVTRRTRLRARELDDLLRTLLEGGDIRIEVRRPSGAGRPANVFVHKDAQGDQDRRAAYAVAQSLGAGMFISWQDPNKTDISGLPLFKGPPLGVGFHDPDDGSGGSGVGPN